MNKKQNVVFSLKYQDGEVAGSYNFQIDDYVDLINFADDKLEQAVWGAKINMKKEEHRVWKRLDATTYRAEYNIPKDVMLARFEKCQELLVNFLEQNSEAVKTEKEQKKEMSEGEDFIV